MEASQLVEALEQVWAGIQDRHPDVPAVIVTLGGSIGVPAGSLRLGHFAARRWIAQDDPAGLSELFVGGEGLAQGPIGVLETLLHEAAHGIAHVRRISDTSRQGRYHNGKYKALGEEVGLTITQTEPIGWSGTALAPGTADDYADELAVLDQALVTYRYAEHQVPELPGDAGPDGGEGPGGTTGPGAAGGGKAPKNGYVLRCNCPPPDPSVRRRRRSWPDSVRVVQRRIHSLTLVVTGGDDVVGKESEFQPSMRHAAFW